MRTIPLALKAILATGNYMMEDIYTVTSHDGGTVLLRITDGQQPISITSGTAEEEIPTDDEKAKTIVIDHTRVAADLVNFPVPIKITDADDPIFTLARADGFDIWFTDEDGNTLDHQVAIWDPTNHLALFYVRIASLSSTVDTVIFLYYGDTAAHTEDGSNPTEVWDENYVGAYIFTTDPALGTLADSTANAKNLVTTGLLTGAELVSCEAGRGWYFDGQYMVGTSEDLLTALGPYTLEIVFKPNLSGAAGAVMYWSSQSHGPATRLAVNDTAGEIRFTQKDQVNNWGYGEGLFSTTAFDVTEEHYAAFTAVTGSGGSAGYGVGLKDGTLKGYIDGEQVGSDIGLDAFSGFGWTAVRIGQAAGLDSNYVGMVAMVLMSKIVRSAAWIETFHNALMSNGTFLTITEAA